MSSNPMGQEPQAAGPTFGRFHGQEQLESPAPFLLYRGRTQGLAGFERPFAIKVLPRNAAGVRADAAQKDGDSRLLWRFPPRRLSAEEVRDSVLYIAGQLDTRMGGPGFRLYEYLQDNVATYVPLDEHPPHTWRRGVYHQNARSSRIDLMTDFDCPDNSFAAPRRADRTRDTPDGRIP